MCEQSRDRSETRPFSPWSRRRARRLALQALYQWRIANSDVSAIEQQFEKDTSHKKVDAVYFREVVRGVILNSEALDALLAPILDRRVRELDPVEHTILRIAAFEMSHRLDVPFKVVVDEAVELAKSFGAEESHKYINGVVDRLADDLRTLEKSTGE